jgi:lambda repressor-like predicted transcriptional regulator
LVNAGLIDHVLDHDARLLAGGTRLITRTSYEGLLRRLEELPIGSSPTCTLEEAMFGRLHPEDWADVLEAILSRSVLANRLEVGAKWTERIMVDAAGVAALLRGRDRPLPAIEISARVAAGLLNVSKDFVSALIENGFLGGTQSSQRIDIDLRSVDAFLRSYRTSRAASTGTSLHPAAIAAEMRRSGFAPAGRAGKLVIWRKSDFTTVFPEPAS